MTKLSRVIAAFLASLIGIVGVAALSSLALADDDERLSVKGTIWVANRDSAQSNIRGFDARTGAVLATVNMAPGSQPGDLAFARGKLYVAEEFGASPSIAIVDPRSGVVLKRFPIGPPPPAPSARPHHAHASPDGRLVAFGLYGTDTVAVVETRTDTLLGPWDTNPDTTNGRAHAGVFSKNGRTLYVASDASNEVVALDPRTGAILWRTTVPGAHELAVMRDGKTAIVARRTADKVAVLDLVTRTFRDVLDLPLPDTLRLSRNDKLLTIGLRTQPAHVAVVDTRTFQFELVRIGPLTDMTTIAGHQWTSRNGRFTFASFEQGAGAGVAVIDHRAGNQVVSSFSYPGRPHGVDLVPARDDDEEDGGDD
jgi:DNA-binding beta-propeller fold protein YncE